MGYVNVGKRNMAVYRGDDDLSEWTEEELIRGKLRSKNGKWTGRAPRFIPAEIHQELTSRRMLEARELLSSNTVAAVGVLIEVATDKLAPTSDRVKAASLILDRTMGKAPTTVKLDVGVREKWEQAIAHSIISIPAELAEAIVVGSYEADEDRAGEFTEPG